MTPTIGHPHLNLSRQGRGRPGFLLPDRVRDKSGKNDVKGAIHELPLRKGRWRSTDAMLRFGQTHGSAPTYPIKDAPFDGAQDERIIPLPLVPPSRGGKIRGTWIPACAGKTCFGRVRKPALLFVVTGEGHNALCPYLVGADAPTYPPYHSPTIDGRTCDIFPFDMDRRGQPFAIRACIYLLRYRAPGPSLCATLSATGHTLRRRSRESSYRRIRCARPDERQGAGNGWASSTF